MAAGTPARSALSDAFVEASTDAVRRLVAADAGFEVALRQALGHARSSHPSVSVDDHALAAFLGARADQVAAGSAGELLATLRVGDLLLVHGCATRDPAALAEVTRLLAAEAQRAARRTGASVSLQEEVVLALSSSLLVGDERGPGLSRYSGRGSLVGFLRAAATRSLVRQLGPERRASPLREDLVEAVTELHDPEIALIKARYRDQVNDCFRQALGVLSGRERALLRLHLIGGLNIDAIGASYRVHRATAARWLSQARSRLLEEAQRQMASRLRLAPHEATSLTRLLQSQLDLSLSRIFSDADG
jgi:RNA polymerase sigma-70 factor (ECF subfamily)